MEVQEALTMTVNSDGDGAVTLTIRGEIDFGNVASLRARLAELIGPDTDHLTVDLGDVHFVDSTTIGVLIQAKKRLAQTDRGLRIVRLKPEVRRVFEMAGLVDYLGL